MKSLVCLLALTGSAGAETTRGLLATSVEVGAIATDAPECTVVAKPHTVKDSELDDLARCLDALRMHRHYSVADAWFGRGNVAVVMTRKDGKIAAIGPIDAKGDDAKLPTFAADFDTNDFAPTSELAKAIAAQKKPWADGWFKVCQNAAGKTTSARATHASEVAAFDKQVIAYLTKKKLAAIEVGGAKVAGCRLVEFNYPGGEEGGVAGDDSLTGDEAPPPPPPPPPPNPPQNVPPTQLEKLRTSGNKLIVPDDKTKIQIQKDGRDKIVGSWKLCVDDAGVPTTVRSLKSTGYPAYDTKIETEMRGWRFQPFQASNGNPAPVCTAFTFIYSQK